VRRPAAVLAATFLLGLAGCGGDDDPPPAPGKPVVLLVPGSGYRSVGADAAEKLVVPPAVWEGMGFRPIAVGYRAGPQGADDVGAAVADARAAHPDAAICLYGESSGGTWSLVTAARDREVACVIAAAAPTDADTWRDSRWPAARAYAHRRWPRLFGRGAADDRYEPYDAWTAARPPAKLMLLYGTADRTVPPQQGRLMADAVPGSTLIELPLGRQPFVHTGVAPRDLLAAIRRIRPFVREAAGLAD
jgi:pimeloyl-ACP methyl ester carboxylesterase